MTSFQRMFSFIKFVFNVVRFIYNYCNYETQMHKHSTIIKLLIISVVYVAN